MLTLPEFRDLLHEVASVEPRSDGMVVVQRGDFALTCCAADLRRDFADLLRRRFTFDTELPSGVYRSRRAQGRCLARTLPVFVV